MLSKFLLQVYMILVDYGQSPLTLKVESEEEFFNFRNHKFYKIFFIIYNNKIYIYIYIYI